MEPQTLEEMERLIRENPLHVSQVMDGLAKIAKDLKKKEKEEKHDRPLRKSG